MNLFFDKSSVIPILIGITLSACSGGSPTDSPAPAPTDNPGAAEVNLTLSKNEISFGPVLTGRTSTDEIDVKNSSTAEAKELFISKTSSPFLLTTTCGLTLAPGASCKIQLVFAASDAGKKRDEISVSYLNKGTLTTRKIAVSGTVQSPAFLEVETFGSSYTDFGNVTINTTVSRVINIKNVGDVAAKSIQIFPQGNDFQVQSCGSTLGAHSECSLLVSFSPTVAGNFSQDIAINYYDEVTNQTVSFHIVGTATNPHLPPPPTKTAELKVLNDKTDFGAISPGSSKDLTLTIGNYNGQTEATNIKIEGLGGEFTYQGNGAFPGTNGTCGKNLAVWDECKIAVTFSPQSAGMKSKIITVSYFDGEKAQSIQHTLEGAGQVQQNPTVQWAIDSGDFGIVMIGSSKKVSFTIENVGDVKINHLNSVLASASFDFSGGPYPGIVGTCKESLNQKSTCTVEIIFTPHAAGNYKQSIYFHYDLAGVQYFSELFLTGIGKEKGDDLRIGDLTGSYGEVKTGSSSTRMFTIYNPSTSNATGLHVAGLSGPFQFKNGLFPGGGTCTDILISGGKCTVGIVFQPTSEVQYKNTIQLKYQNNGVDGTVSFDLLGSGKEPSQAAKYLAMLEDSFVEIDPTTDPVLAPIRAAQQVVKPVESPLLPSVLSNGHSQNFSYIDFFDYQASLGHELWKTHLNVPRVIGYTFRGDTRAPHVPGDSCLPEWKNGFTLVSSVTGNTIQYPAWKNPDGTIQDCGVKDSGGFWPRYTLPQDILRVEAMMKQYQQYHGVPFDPASMPVNLLPETVVEMNVAPSDMQVSEVLNWYLQNVMSLQAHVWNNYDYKGFVSTSRSPIVAKNWKLNGYTYVSLTEGGFYMPEKDKVVVGGKSFTQYKEQEIVNVGGIPWDDVVAYSKVTNGVFTGKFFVRKGLDKMDPQAYTKILRILAGEVY